MNVSSRALSEGGPEVGDNVEQLECITCEFTKEITTIRQQIQVNNHCFVVGSIAAVGCGNRRVFEIGRAFDDQSLGKNMLEG